MKKILITGQNSYIGNSFEEYLSKNENYQVFKISVRNDDWKNMNFSEYDVVINVAGIAHKKETNENKQLYFNVNRDLAIEIAKKTKLDGVCHYIYISTISVFGKTKGEINSNTKCEPINAYGQSKLEAEKILKELETENFSISIVRPPMVYGKNCVGNYSTLRKIAKKSFIFPKVENKRSMIYIENLCEFLRLLLENKDSGIFMPQNKEFINTSEMVCEIAKIYNKNIIFSKFLGKIFTIFDINIVNKAFGSLTFDKEINNYTQNYCIVDFKESIKRTEIY